MYLFDNLSKSSFRLTYFLLEIKFVTGRDKNWLVFRSSCEFERRANHNVFIVFPFVRHMTKI